MPDSRRRPAIEPLEDRTAPAVLTWTGAGVTPNFSDDANWGKAKPGAGDELVFGAAAARRLANNDLVNALFRAIRFDAPGYTLAGRGLRLSDRVTASAAGADVVLMNVALVGRTTFDIAADARVWVNGAISSPTPLALMKVGPGTLAFGGSAGNSYAGPTVVASGVLQFAKAGGPAVGGDVFVHAGRVEYVGGGGQVRDDAAVHVAGVGVYDLNGRDEAVSAVTLTGGSIRTGTGTLTALAVRSDASEALATLSGHLDLAGGFRPIHVCGGLDPVGGFRPTRVTGGPAAAGLEISAAVHNGGLYKTGDGKLVLSGASDYTGITAVVAGTLEVRSDAALGGTRFGTAVYARGSLVLSGGVKLREPLTLQGAGVLGGGALQAVGKGNVVASSVTLRDATTVGAGVRASLLFRGVVSGPGRLTTVGTGVITLAAANTFTGGTAVEGGSLEARNPGWVAAPGTVTVDNGGTLTGAGKVSAVVVLGGGSLAPGSGVGVLTTGDVRLTPGAAFRPELDGPATDVLNVLGAVRLGGADLAPIGLFTGGIVEAYTLIRNDGADAVVGTFARLAEGDILEVGGNGLSSFFRISYRGGDGNDVVLTRTRNRGPVAADAADGTKANTALPGQLRATDPEGDGPIKYRRVDNASSGTAVVYQDGTFVYTPNAGFYGTDSFTFVANDRRDDGNVARFTITVAKPPPPPPPRVTVPR